ncbi:hypothetical protein HNR42_000875 [Deinobacterium chartae]|uniref:Uncharacterized protein n=1 Tax=Deinobacterium chartae TaxID=521158 RepID=A0A841HZM6_9DEIO|nr:SIS domain-containing protein [Deinobacterium chartae]MBB6097458.1 hypothetical protein [Deinobacterium chartae]
MLDDRSTLERDRSGLWQALLELPGSYAGPNRVWPAPYGAIGYGEGALAARLGEDWLSAPLVLEGTQFVLGNLDFGEAESYADIADARGVGVVRAGPSSSGGLTFLVPPSPLSHYSYAQYLAYSSGHAQEAAAADEAMRRLAARCTPAVPTDENPAKQLAWKLWTRTPLLLAARDHAARISAWHVLLARIGKSMSVPLGDEPLLVLSGGFEARHESGDQRVALILSTDDPTLTLAREMLETRVDEIIEVLPDPDLEGYAADMQLWYLGAWTAYYLALAYGQDPSDARPLSALLALEEPQEEAEQE